MVAFLKKPKNSEGFHKIVYFLNQSTLRYALITNPTIYTSQIKQFWQTATVKTLDSGEVEINAIVDGNNKTITEASVRSSLQLADADGISNKPTTEIFEQLALMGFKSTGWDQFSSNIATALICLANNRTFNFSKLIFDGFSEVHTPLLPTMLIMDQTGLCEGSAIPVASQHTPIIDTPSTLQPPVRENTQSPTSTTAPETSPSRITSSPSLSPQTHQSPTSSPLRDINRQAAKIPQSQFPTQTQVADEATLTSMDVGAGGAATTDIGLDAGQGSGTIHKTPTRLNDEPLLGVNIPGSTEGSLSQTELTDLVLKLAKKVEGLETKLQNTKKIYGKVYIELGRMIKDIDLAAGTSLVQPHVAVRERQSEDDTFNLEEAFPLPSDAVKKFNLTERDESTIEYFHFVTPTKISASGEAHSSDISPEDQLGVLSAEKILADTGRSGTVPKTVSEVQTYTRRKRAISTGSGGVSTASRIISTAEETVSTTGTSDFLSAAKPSVNTAGDYIQLKDKDPGQREGKALMEVNEILKKFKKGEYKQISHDEEVAQKLHAEELAKGGYKQSHFKGISYEDIRPIFESIWDQNHAFVPKNSKIEKEVMKRPGFDLQQESIKKNEKIEASGFVQKQPAEEEKEKKKDAKSSKQVEEEIAAKARKDKDKRQKKQDDPEKHTLMKYVEVISDSEEVISMIPLAVKSTIINWKSYCKGDVGYYKIHKADGSYKTYIFFSEMLNDFDREDLLVLYILFNEKYASTGPGFDDLMLWVDMKIMFEPDVMMQSGKIIIVKN
ncbi:hypothetical protein Tco_0948137 [Tanacetum coccineum]